MKQMTNSELTIALRNPWEWCLSEIFRRNLTSAILSAASGINRSTVRALYNSRSKGPTNEVMVVLVQYLLDTRNEKPMPEAVNRNSGLLPGQSRNDVPLVKDAKAAAAALS